MAERVSLITWMAEFQVRFWTWRTGALVGTDRFGNRYYRSRRTRPGERERRWVLYAGEPDVGSVPPEWYGWLRGGPGDPPPSRAAGVVRSRSEADPRGAVRAQLPPGHSAACRARPRVAADYEAWSPPET